MELRYLITSPYLTSKGSVIWATKDGKKHSCNGPAVIRADGTVEYWLGGVRADPLTEMLIKENERRMNEEIARIREMDLAEERKRSTYKI